ncbi:MAG: GGDEF domain-containing protein, partial [Thermoleophilaceae bacterium]|nr:GGDEF domain-containing protein [Thermoleophilaceae bacterium]
MPQHPAIPVTEDERRLAGLAAAVFWMLGGFTVLVGLLIPGAVEENETAFIILGSAAVAWGGICFALPWERVYTWVFHVPAVAALAIVAGGMALSGGAESPFAMYLFFTTAYCAYFYAPRIAIPYFAGCAAVAMLPMVYDPSGPYLWEGGIVAIGCFVMGGTFLFVKGQLVGAREQARDLSLLDSLTGLANRRALMSELEHRVGGRRQGDRLGLLMLDLDSFKDANTMYGHPGGDRVLRETAQALRRAVRGEDMVSRLGGDEFAVVAREADARAMSVLSERVLGEIRLAGATLELPGFHLTASVGWATCP